MFVNAMKLNQQSWVYLIGTDQITNCNMFLTGAASLSWHEELKGHHVSVFVNSGIHDEPYVAEKFQIY